MGQLIVDAFKEGGVVIGFFIVFSIFFFIILNHFLKQSNRLTDIVVAQNNSFNNMNSNWQKIVDEHTSASREYHTRASEADRFQREEHLRILDGMTLLMTTFKEEHKNRSDENMDVAHKLENICKAIEKCEKQ